jgi:hypothetical protein
MDREGTMKPLVLLAFILFASAAALAGEIYGTISEDGKPVSAGVKIEVAAGENLYAAETDKFGAYRVFVEDKGKCILTVYYKEQEPKASIFSYEKATRYDWVLETVEGKLVLKRK